MRVGFIGLGNMGWPMAANLAKAGHTLVVTDADGDRARRFAAGHGCQSGDVAATADANVVITMLPTGKIVNEVLLRSDRGVFQRAAKPGTIVVDMSSSEPVGTKDLGKALAERKIVLIDAPVSGGVIGAASGNLAIMVGADDSTALATVRPLLEAMGARIFETGSLGSGHAMKALNNFVAGAGFAAAAEALLVGERFGLNPDTMVDIMNVSTGRSFHTDVVLKNHVTSRKFSSGFSVGLLAKDVKIAADLAQEMKLDAPVARLVADRWAGASEKLGFGEDNTKAIQVWDRSIEG